MTDLDAQYRAGFAELTPEQALDCVLSQIRDYAKEHSLSAEQVRTLFEAGMAAASVLKPALVVQAA